MSDNISSNNAPTNNINVNIVENALAKSFDNFTQAFIKEQKRARLRKFIFRFLMFGLFLIVALSLFSENTNHTNSKTSLEHTAVIRIDGEIAASTPSNALMINRSLRQAFENKQSKGIILRINSPGGSPVQSGMVYDEIKRLRKLYPNKIIYAVAEDITASGAYYIASAADFIYADKASMIGSIGVLMDGFGFNNTMQKLGVERRLYTAGKNKGMLDPFSSENPEHKMYIQNMLNGIHKQFITAVKNGRGQRLKENADTFSGLVWNGDEALAQGLIDHIGNVESVARDVLKQEHMVDYTIEEGLADRLAKQFGTYFGHAISSRLVQEIAIK
jgi:protease IV